MTSQVAVHLRAASNFNYSELVWPSGIIQAGKQRDLDSNPLRLL